MPVLNGGQYLLINAEADSLQQPGSSHIALLINGELNYGQALSSPSTACVDFERRCFSHAPGLAAESQATLHRFTAPV